MSHVGILFQVIEDSPPKHIGKEHVERDCSRVKLAGQFKAIGAARRKKDFKTAVARQIAGETRKMRIIFNDQQDEIAGLYRIAIIVNRFLLINNVNNVFGWCTYPRWRRHGLVAQWQVKREGTPTSRSALQQDFAA